MFQGSDPKGSKRSRLDFENKEKEVGIAAAIHLEKYIKKNTPLQLQKQKERRKRILAKQKSKEVEPLPIHDFIDADLGGETDEEPEPGSWRRM